MLPLHTFTFTDPWWEANFCSDSITQLIAAGCGAKMLYNTLKVTQHMKQPYEDSFTDQKLQLITYVL